MSKKIFVLLATVLLAGFGACSGGSSDNGPPSFIDGEYAGRLLWIKPGTFTMGTDNSADTGANPAYSVKLTKGFYMGKYEVTQALYEEVMKVNPSYYKGGGDLPVEMVTWYDAIEFCNKLSEAEGLQPVYLITGRTPADRYPITSATVEPNWEKNGYRLPFEAQWEYACRAGTTTPFYTGDVNSDTGWCLTYGDSETHPVGQKPANPWGLYDIAGNVYEWCWDWYGDYSGAETDPKGPGSGTDRVCRGGSWHDALQFLRSTYRKTVIPSNRHSYLGLRLVRP